MRHAATYAAIGWRMVPCHTVLNGLCTCADKAACQPAGKHPRGDRWQMVASSDLTAVQSWREYWPRHNLGLVTGPESNVFVVDIDTKGGGMEQWAAWMQKYGQIPDTPVSETGSGGNHVFFLWPDAVDIRNKVRLIDGVSIDIRGRNGLAILPPSITGGSYTWIEGLAPWEVKVAPAPSWLIALMSSAATNARTGGPLDTAGIMAGVGEGRRNDAIFRLASSLRSQEYQYDQAKELVLQAARNCQPPLDEKEALVTLDGVYQRYAPGRSWSFQNPYQHQAIGTDGPWQQPVALDAAVLPPFPVEALPTWVRRYVEEVARVTITPLDLPGMCSLAAMAAGVAGKARVQLKVGGWFEPLNVYSVTVARPGSRKSAVFERLSSPIVKYEKRIRGQREEEIVRLRSRLEIMESEYKTLRAAAAKTEDRAYKSALMHEVEEKAVAIHRMKKLCVMPNLIVDDVTPENLKTQLHDQGGRIAALSAEGDIFGMMSGRYQTNGINIDVYIKGWGGDLIKVNRASGREEVIYNPALTIGVCTQKKSLRGMSSQHLLNYKGLFQRFCYAVAPDAMEDIEDDYDNEQDPDPIAYDIDSAYQDNMTALVALPLPIDGDTTPIIHLSDGAKQVFRQFERMVNKELSRGSLSKIDELFEWGRKLAGAVGRLAGLFHMADNITDGCPWDWEMSGATMERACQVGAYLIPHAIVAFRNMDTSPAHDIAKRILDTLTDNGMAAFNRQDAVRWARVHGRQLDEPLFLLIDHGYIRPDKKTSYLVNPEWDRKAAGCSIA